MVSKPTYPHKHVGSIETLAKILGLTTEQLTSLAENSDKYFFVAKRIEKKDKSIRLTYDVKPELKSIHAKICNYFLKRVIYPDYLQGGVKGKDYLSNCKIHVQKKFIIKEDISNFFPSISQKIICEIWCEFFKFPPDVAQLITQLVTLNGYLVQGGKASGFLCNLALWKREEALVAELSKKGFLYSRFVDDITISCARNVSKKEQVDIIGKIYGMLKSIDVKPNRAKHKTMSNGERQQLHKVNLNSEIPTLPKKEREKIKTAVFQCEQSYRKINTIEYETLFNSTMGRVNTLARMHPVIGKQFKERLQKIKPM